jgi:hypothetical protein
MSLAEITVQPRLADYSGAVALVRKARRWMWISVGGFLVAAGVVIAPLPGPFGLPISVLGLVVILRHSNAAKRGFIRLQRRYPRWLYPVRRMMRGCVVAVMWQAMLRVERFAAPGKRWRVLRRMRVSLFRRGSRVLTVRAA